jgi:FMN phosphatase YigB (HAD superfamily)
MPFIKRDATGEIVALFREQSPEARDYLPPADPEVQAFIGASHHDGGESFSQGQPEKRHDLVTSDLDMIRVYEDLIDVLISKHVVVLTDFPQAAQEKLMRRKRLRSSFSSLTDALSSEDDEGIFRI